MSEGDEGPARDQGSENAGVAERSKSSGRERSKSSYRRSKSSFSQWMSQVSSTIAAIGSLALGLLAIVVAIRPVSSSALLWPVLASAAVGGLVAATAAYVIWRRTVRGAEAESKARRGAIVRAYKAALRATLTVEPHGGRDDHARTRA
jgi:hypothetical protein